jgi:hypothetical protein
VTDTTFNLDSPATSNNQYFILVRFYYSSNEYYVSPNFVGRHIVFVLSVTVCRRNSSETTEQNFMKLGR